MSKNEVKEAIRDLLKGKPEGNHLFFHSGKFMVSRKGNLQVLSNDSVNQLYKINDNLEVWHLKIFGVDEPIPAILASMKHKTIEAQDAGTFDMFMKILT